MGAEENKEAQAERRGSCFGDEGADSMKPFVGLSGWHRGPGLGCYESDDRRAAVEKVWRKKAWKLWLYEGWLRRSSKLVGTYPTRKAAMMAYQPNPTGQVQP